MLFLKSGGGIRFPNEVARTPQNRQNADFVRANSSVLNKSALKNRQSADFVAKSNSRSEPSGT
jgi:hypothetical protein